MNLRTDKTIDKSQLTKGQTKVYKTLRKKNGKEGASRTQL